MLTVEPGIYFMGYALRKAREAPALQRFFNWERLEDFKAFGGIRLEARAQGQQGRLVKRCKGGDFGADVPETSWT